MKKIMILMLAISFFICGCEKESENNDPEIVQTHELIGKYFDVWGGVHIISNSVWDQGQMSGRFNIKYFDSDLDVIIAQNDKDNQFNPEKWSRFDYKMIDSKIYTCQTVYDKATQKEAMNATAADSSKLDTGCNGFGWTEVVKAVEESIDKGDAKIVEWASGFESYAAGTDLDEEWKTPDKALSVAEGTSSDVVSLGTGGSIVLTFEKAVTDGEGHDFAVFENSLNDNFLELGFVEVSSNGTDFVRFDSYYLGLEPVETYGGHDSSLIWGFAGKFKQGKGTQFDLKNLTEKAKVVDKTVDLAKITHIRIVDVVGDGSEIDTLGNAIYDPYPTTGSAGFDLDAVGIMNVKE